MDQRSQLLALRACALVLGAFGLAACAARTGGVPMAGQRNRSTSCVFGLRGVRVALDDSAPDAIDLTISMSTDAKALRHCARRLLQQQAKADEESFSASQDFRELDISHQLATARVESIPGGVRIRVTPDAKSDPDLIRDELAARIEQASEDSRCD